MQVANMGNYAHGNQPAQHMIYLYNWAGEPWKAQKWVREVMNRLYKSSPDGYCGDEDNGQTSAWYVFSALGFYPVCPVSDEYVIGTPLFRHAVVHLENGNKLVINSENIDGSEDELDTYISDMKVNDSKWQHNYLKYNQLKKGATIEFKMSKEPCMTRGTQDNDKPYSFSK